MLEMAAAVRMERLLQRRRGIAQEENALLIAAILELIYQNP